ncbi:MAG TPA: sigma-54 dependent transcriptional regulator [Deltaproteobacteria bacterium]|nr:sigma-54 dependent transcriptional regulator [Deltaproteobacteria bacterium]HOI07447.1 sigma-54 dependent transcriptional regulator [Deltaproteobacteria bacterium]
MRFSILLIDDEESIRDGVAIALDTLYDVRAYARAEEGLEAIRTDPPDLVLLDIGLPGMNGIEALTRIRAMHPEMLVIMITAYEDAQTVISAMKLGAYDYIVKPILMDGLEVTIRNALESIRLRKEVRLLQERYLKDNLPGFIAQSDEILDVMRFIGQVAKSPDTPILILGETGTGKELIASAIHFRSPNCQGPFVPVNCAAIPRELIESELFGYEKGAFSGAGASGKRGLIEDAEGGTLFLDEVGDLSLDAQAKLLRFLQNGEFYRVGSTQKRTLSTRVVSATNRDLEAMMEQGLFRQDLYYRLGVVKVRVPSLNDRREDIVPLAETFLLTFSRKFGKTFTSISPEAVKALTEHRWTGNVRELKNVVEQGVLVGEGPVLELKDLGLARSASARAGEPSRETGAVPEAPLIPPEGIVFEEVEKDFRRRYFEEALRLSGGNECRAAKLLGMNHHTFRYRKKRVF